MKRETIPCIPFIPVNSFLPDPRHPRKSAARKLSLLVRLSHVRSCTFVVSVLKAEPRNTRRYTKRKPRNKKLPSLFRRGAEALRGGVVVQKNQILFKAAASWCVQKTPLLTKEGWQRLPLTGWFYRCRYLESRVRRIRENHPAEAAPLLRKEGSFFFREVLSRAAFVCLVCFVVRFQKQ